MHLRPLEAIAGDRSNDKFELLANGPFSRLVYQGKFALVRLAEFADNLPVFVAESGTQISALDMTYATGLAKILFGSSTDLIVTTSGVPNQLSKANFIEKTYFTTIERTISKVLSLSANRADLHADREYLLEVLFSSRNYARIVSSEIGLMDWMYKRDSVRFSELISQAIRRGEGSESFVSSVGLLKVVLSDFKDFHLYFDDFRSVVEFEIGEINTLPTGVWPETPYISASDIVHDIPKFIDNIPSQILSDMLVLLLQWQSAIDELRPVAEQFYYGDDRSNIEAAVSALVAKLGVNRTGFLALSFGSEAELENKARLRSDLLFCSDLFL